METARIRQTFLDYYVERGHAVMPPASLVPQEDPTTLFTGSGMQPLIPYFLGADHPLGDRLVDSQPCFRAEDVDEVGDERHTTFFEMLGNWGLGSYSRREQLPWVFEFLTRELGVDTTRLYASVFRGVERYAVPRDAESLELWTKLFIDVGVEPKVADMGDAATASKQGTDGARILLFDASQNWWSRSGPPEGMPDGEPGGPDSEIFYEFAEVEHDPRFGAHCHVHCDCGRFVEIGNSVFMEYVRTGDGFKPLPRRNVDFGGGLERLAMAATGYSDVFKLDVLKPIIDHVGALSGASYGDEARPMRIIADHARAVVFLAANGVAPSNSAQGYVMRRLIRRALRQALFIGISDDLMGGLVPVVAAPYADSYPEISDQQGAIAEMLDREEVIFRKTLMRGTREFARVAGERLTGKAVFTLFDTYGFPPELSLEEANRAGIPLDPNWKDEYDKDMLEQRERSRTAGAGTFRGGLADQSERTTRLHTATHLLYKALRLVLGDHVVQRGSNITAERLRFDFSHPAKMTPEEARRVEAVVNRAIGSDLPMSYRELPTDRAFEEGALGAFGDKYGPTVKVYVAGDPDGEWFSKEICGGPHVQRTSEVGPFRIVKEESSSAGVRRIRAVVADQDDAAGEHAANTS